MSETETLQTLARLAATIESRKTADPSASWTAKLIAEPDLAARKLGEEAIETVIAAMQDDTAALTAEAADLIYHLLALLAAKGVTLEDVAAELARREGQSGLDEKAGR